jgi:hypothetical protein
MKVERIIHIIITPESENDCNDIHCRDCRFAPLMNPHTRECYNREKRKAWRFLGEATNNFLNDA